MRKIIWMALAVTLGCSEDAAEDKSDDTGGGGSGPTGPVGDFDDYINTSVDPGGDLSCYTATEPGTESAADGCAGQIRTMYAEVLDFQTDNPVDEATVQIYLVDGIFGAPDHQLTSDLNGAVSAAMPTCEPFTYRSSTDPALDQTKVTIESHDVLPYSNTDVVSHEMNSVSSATYKLIPALIGISPDVNKGVVAGVVYDCNGDPMAGAQVLAKSSGGDILDGGIIGTGAVDGVKAGYFVDEYPSRTQIETSSDGIWVLVDVPAGEVTVEAYVSDGSGGYRHLASTQLEVLEDSINISSVYAGIADGVKMPESCLEACL